VAGGAAVGLSTAEYVGRMARSPRWRRLATDERRTELLETGLELFTGRSLQSIGIQEIAEKAGVSPGLIYHYFGSKHGFFLEVVRYSEQRTRDAMTPDDDEALDDAQRLRAALSNYFAHVEQTRASYVAIVQGAAPNDPDVAAIVDEFRWTSIDLILAALGQEASEPCRRTLYGWTAMVETIALQGELTPEQQDEVVTICHKTLEAILASCGVLQPRVVDTEGQITRPLDA
jgi:AcrR family transcriptional regulator